jgi:hypothetical protein
MITVSARASAFSGAVPGATSTSIQRDRLRSSAAFTAFLPHERARFPQVALRKQSAGSLFGSGNLKAVERESCSAEHNRMRNV